VWTPFSYSRRPLNNSIGPSPAHFARAARTDVAGDCHRLVSTPFGITSTLPAGSSKSRVTSHRIACEQVMMRRAW